MKVLWLASVLLISANLAYAGEDCPAAVDAAEAQNPNAFKNCDYSDKGLNGVLHRALSKKSEASSEEQAPAKTEGKPVVKEEVVEKVVNEGEFASAQQLQTLRFTLIQKAARECSKGFVVDGEKYLPVSSKATRLELIYHCL